MTAERLDDAIREATEDEGGLVVVRVVMVVVATKRNLNY